MGTDAMRTQFWGLGAEDWADIQAPLHSPLYQAILDALTLPRGSTLLDGGCGSGILSSLATDRGLIATGLDASEMFIDAARRRAPAATFILGDLQELPFDVDSFDAVVGCNSFQFVSNPAAAVREATRVLHAGGRFAIAVFDAPEKCDGAKPIDAIYSLLPTPPPGAPGPFALSSADTLETLVRDGGLAPEPAGVHRVDTPWIYPDRETALRAFMSAGPAYQARAIVGEEKLRTTLDAAIAPHRQPDGTYQMQNVFMFVVGRKTEA